MSYKYTNIGLCRFIVLAMLASGAGCQCTRPQSSPQYLADQCAAPRELAKVVLPTYTIEPPDILIIEAINVVPLPPYRLKTFDAVSLQVMGTLAEDPIEGVFRIEPGGILKLGQTYGNVKATGMTAEELEQEIDRHLRQYLKEPKVMVSLAETVGKQQIAGEHLVGPDGTVTLGSYGSVSVVGLTIAEAKVVIEQYLSKTLEDPEVSVDVFGYNSKVYYIVTQGAGTGDRLYRFPVTGNETVLDAIAQVNGLEQVSSKKIWIARPKMECDGVQILPVCWNDITARGSTNTNYQILPGDRVFIEEDKLIAFDTGLGKLTAPLERIMGFSLLGATTATRLSGNVLKGGGNPSGSN